MKKISFKRIIIVIMLITAFACIGLGAYRVWQSFRSFDETILQEKDSQYYGIIRSDDSNIENAINSFTREAKSFFSRKVLKDYRENWEASEDKNTGQLRAYLAQNTLTANPIYKDVFITKSDKVIVSASGSSQYAFTTEADEGGYRLASTPDGTYCLIYEEVAKGRIKYCAAIDLEQLYDYAIGISANGEVMLVDQTSSIMIYRQGDDTEPSTNIIIAPTSSTSSDAVMKFAGALIECQKHQKSGGKSLELTSAEGELYSARFVMLPTDETVNGRFAIGINVNYEAAAKPSRIAAEQIFLNGAVVLVGVVLLMVILFILRQGNIARDTELEKLKKRNETVENINQKMIALTHHQRLETIGTMTASIAHEFNNLLTPIMGYSMMSMEMLPDDATDIQENLMEVYNASMKAKEIVTRLSDLSKKGKEEKFVELNPNELVRNALKITLPAKPKSVDVKGSFSASKSLIRGDSTQLSQLVVNIVLNAYDAMKETGGGSLLVSTRVEGNDIVIRFKDTGPGMSDETVAKIFDPFYTTKESGKGTGLGLAIVQQIVETHGGKLYVDSHLGEGTEFKFAFPIIEMSSFLDRTRTVQINAEDLKKMHEAETMAAAQSAKE